MVIFNCILPWLPQSTYCPPCQNICQCTNRKENESPGPQPARYRPGCWGEGRDHWGVGVACVASNSRYSHLVAALSSFAVVALLLLLSLSSDGGIQSCSTLDLLHLVSYTLLLEASVVKVLDAGFRRSSRSPTWKWLMKRPTETCVRKKCVHELIMLSWSKFIEKRHLLCYGKK